MIIQTSNTPVNACNSLSIIGGKYIVIKLDDYSYQRLGVAAKHSDFRLIKNSCYLSVIPLQKLQTSSSLLTRVRACLSAVGRAYMNWSSRFLFSKWQSFRIIARWSFHLDLMCKRCKRWRPSERRQPRPSQYSHHLSSNLSSPFQNLHIWIHRKNGVKGKSLIRSLKIRWLVSLKLLIARSARTLFVEFWIGSAVSRHLVWEWVSG